MSEEMILSGAFFDNSMPKWATEETMKRIANDFKKDNNQTRKQHDKMIMLLGKIVQNSTKEEKLQRDTLKEIKTIAKEIKESNKANKELVKEIKKSNKLSEDANKQAKKSSSSNTNTGSSDVVDTSEIEDHLLDANKRLEDIYGIMKRSTSEMLSSMEERNKMMGKSNAYKPPSTSAIPDTVREKSFANDEILENVNSMFERQRESRGRSGMGITNEITASRGPMKKFNGRIMAMIGAIGSFVGKIKKFGAAILNFVKNIPFIGTKIAAAIGALSTAMDLANIISESFDDYRKLINRGISFARANVENTRMDGIRVRKMIGELGITYEAAMKSMENAAALLNDIGVEGYVQTIRDVMGSASDASSFMNKVMMAQDEIGEFAGEYLRSLKIMGDYERLNSQERYKGIQLFIKSTRSFSQMTGRSIQELKGIMTDLSSDSMVTTYLGGLDKEQRKQAEMSIGMLSATFGKESPFYKMMIEAITDPTESGLYRTDANAPLQVIGGALGQDLMGQFTNLINSFETNTANENSILLAQIGDTFKERYEALGDVERKQLLSQMGFSGNATMKDVMDSLRAGFARLGSEEDVREIVRRDGDVSQQSTEEAQTAQLARATKQSAEAALEYATASLADSDASRFAMRTSYELMVQTNNITEKGARAAVSSAHTLADTLPSISGKIEDIISIMTGSKTRSEKGEEALKSSDLGPIAKLQREELAKFLNSSGMETTIGETGGRRDDKARRYQKHKKNLEELEEHGMDLETLLEQAKSNNSTVANVARDLLMYMGSEQMKGVLSDSDRKRYRQGFDVSLEDMDEESRKQYEDTIEQKMRSGSPAMLLKGKLQHEQKKIQDAAKKQMEEEAKKAESASGQAIETANKEADEQEAKRQAAAQNASGNGQGTAYTADGLPVTIAKPQSNLDNPENDVNLLDMYSQTLNTLSSVASSLDNIGGIIKVGNEQSLVKLNEITNNTKNNNGSLGS